MERLSRNISMIFVNKGYAPEDDVDRLRFAIEVVLSQTLSFLTIMFIGILIHRVYETLVFVSVYAVFRILHDGYHAKTYTHCLVMTVVVYLSCLFVTMILDYDLSQSFIIYGGVFNIIMTVISFRWQDLFEDNAKLFRYIIVFVVYNIVVMTSAIFMFRQTLLVLMICVGLSLAITTAIGEFTEKQGD